MTYCIINDENIFSITVEKTAGLIGSSLSKAVMEDIKTFKGLFAVDFSPLFKTNLLQSYSPTSSYMSDDFRKLRNIFLDKNNHGDIANYLFFRWDERKNLVGIKHFDPVSLDDIVGYDRQKHILLTNTQAFLANKPYQHVLLVGARGTGKLSIMNLIASSKE